MIYIYVSYNVLGSKGIWWKLAWCERVTFPVTTKQQDVKRFRKHCSSFHVSGQVCCYNIYNCCLLSFSSTSGQDVVVVSIVCYYYVLVVGFSLPRTLLVTCKGWHISLSIKKIRPIVVLFHFTSSLTVTLYWFIYFVDSPYLLNVNIWHAYN